MASLTSYLRTDRFLPRAIRHRGLPRCWRMDRFLLRATRRPALRRSWHMDRFLLRVTLRRVAAACSEFSPSFCFLPTLIVPGNRPLVLEPGIVA
jgi:hypothetical protein